MAGSDKPAHVKSKRSVLEQKAPKDGHVRPLSGREARQIRQAAQRAARAFFAQTAPPPEAPPPVRMSPRPWRRALGQDLDRDDPQRLEYKRLTDRVRPRGVVWMSWRWVSGGLSLALIILLGAMLSSEAFYVSTVAVGGENYLTREEIYAYSKVARQHVFWIDPAQVEADLESSNNIAEAQVRVGWPPQMVQIVVRERDPALIWEQGDDRVWVDINGQVMFQREDRADLLRVVVDQNELADVLPILPNSQLDTEIIHGALLLRSRLRDINVLLYHPLKGLGWRDPRGWMAWFGIGDNMDMKARVYEALVAYNIDELQFGEINLADPDHPVYTILWRKSEPLSN